MLPQVAITAVRELPHRRLERSRVVVVLGLRLGNVEREVSDPKGNADVPEAFGDTGGTGLLGRWPPACRASGGRVLMVMVGSFLIERLPIGAPSC